MRQVSDFESKNSLCNIIMRKMAGSSCGIDTKVFATETANKSTSFNEMHIFHIPSPATLGEKCVATWKTECRQHFFLHYTRPNQIYEITRANNILCIDFLCMATIFVLFCWFRTFLVWYQFQIFLIMIFSFQLVSLLFFVLLF